MSFMKNLSKADIKRVVDSGKDIEIYDDFIFRTTKKVLEMINNE